MFYKDSRNLYRVPALDGLDWLEYGFGTRASGFWVPENLAMLRQVHSDICVPVDGVCGMIGEGDALVSDKPGVFVGVRTADCLPLLIADERLRVVAAVHAGWRGTVKQIAAKAVRTLSERFGSRPEDLIAAIGPGICGRCYEVGPEVAREFAGWFPELAGAAGKARIDLAEANRLQLLAAGLPEDRVIAGAPCTFDHPSDFYSYRRGPHKEGRMLSAAGIRPR